MENNLKNESKVSEAADGAISSTPKITISGGMPEATVKSINLSGDQFIISDQLPGVFCENVQYYDLKNIGYINNTGMANLIDLLRSLLEHDVDVQFVNVNERIKNKIKALGLDHILICS